MSKVTRLLPGRRLQYWHRGTPTAHLRKLNIRWHWLQVRFSPAGPVSIRHALNLRSARAAISSRFKSTSVAKRWWEPKPSLRRR